MLLRAIEIGNLAMRCVAKDASSLAYSIFFYNVYMCEDILHINIYIYTVYTHTKHIYTMPSHIG